MKEKLIAAGWELYYDCVTCAGKKMYYKHSDKPGYEVRANMKTNTFVIVLKNRVISQGFHAYQLDAALNKFNL